MPRRISKSAQPGYYARKEFQKDRDAWAHVNGNEFTLFIGSGDEETDDYLETPGTPSVRVGVRHDARMTFVDLSSLTSDELEVVRLFWERAISTARPICKKLDDIAESTDWDTDNDINDDTLMRKYRPAPGLVVRTGRQLGHDPCVLDGPSTDGSLAELESEHGAAGDADREVHHREPAELGASDDAAEDDGDSVVAAIRGERGLPEQLSVADAGATGTASDS